MRWSCRAWHTREYADKDVSRQGTLTVHLLRHQYSVTSLKNQENLSHIELSSGSFKEQPTVKALIRQIADSLGKVVEKNISKCLRLVDIRE